MKISKDLAGQIAFKLTENSRLAAEVINKEYQELVTLAYESQTPQLVKDCFKKHPEWHYTRQTLCFSGHGFNYERVSTTRPIICNAGTDASLALTAKSAEILLKAK